MAWGMLTEVSAPIETYEVMHRELLRSVGADVEGMFVHLARPTATGFQLVEVWESREPYDRYAVQVVGPVMSRLLGEQPPPQMRTDEFEVRGLVLPRGGIAW